MCLDANNPSDLIRQSERGGGDLKLHRGEIKNIPRVKNEDEHSFIVASTSSKFVKAETLASEEEYGPRVPTKVDEFVSGYGCSGNIDACTVAAEEVMLPEEVRVPIDQDVLLENMREEHNLRFKTGVLMGMRAEEGIRVRGFYCLQYFVSIVFSKFI